MLMDTPDETLAMAAAGGDRAAFAVLISRHYDRIHGLAYRMSGNRADAEDLAQETLVSGFQSPQSLTAPMRPMAILPVLVNVPFSWRRPCLSPVPVMRLMSISPKMQWALASASSCSKECPARRLSAVSSAAARDSSGGTAPHTS